MLTASHANAVFFFFFERLILWQLLRKHGYREGELQSLLHKSQRARLMRLLYLASFPQEAN